MGVQRHASSPLPGTWWDYVLSSVRWEHGFHFGQENIRGRNICHFHTEAFRSHYVIYYFPFLSDPGWLYQEEVFGGWAEPPHICSGHKAQRRI